MTGWTKSVRALFAALFTTLLALLMHLGAGGSVSIPGTVVVFVLVLWAAMIVAGRRLGYVTLAGLLGLGQVLMHLTMSWSAHTFAHAGAHAGPAQSGSGQAGAAGTGSTSAEAALNAHAGHIVRPPAPLTWARPHPRSACEPRRHLGGDDHRPPGRRPRHRRDPQAR